MPAAAMLREGATDDEQIVMYQDSSSGNAPNHSHNQMDTQSFSEEAEGSNAQLVTETNIDTQITRPDTNIDVSLSEATPAQSGLDLPLLGRGVELRLHNHDDQQVSHV